MPSSCVRLSVRLLQAGIVPTANLETMPMIAQGR